jgi:hypothetical protein
MGANSSQRATPVMGLPLSVGVLPDPDRATDQAGRIGVGFESVVSNEGGLALVKAAIAGAGGDGAETFDRGDEREAALLGVLLMEEGMALRAERIEAQAAGPSLSEDGHWYLGSSPSRNS